MAAVLRYVQTFLAPSVVRSRSDTLPASLVLPQTCCGIGRIMLSSLASIHCVLYALSNVIVKCVSSTIFSEVQLSGALPGL